MPPPPKKKKKKKKKGAAAKSYRDLKQLLDWNNNSVRAISKH